MRDKHKAFPVRHFAKWLGTTLAVLILVFWVLSTPLFSKKCLSIDFGGEDTSCTIGYGAIFIMFGPAAGLAPGERAHVYWFRADEELPSRIAYGFRMPERLIEGNLHSGVLPLWLVFLVVATPTAYLWYRENRFSKAHCQTCGYNLFGNVSGICSECGTAINERAMLGSTGEGQSRSSTEP